jgi:hypothetical protein
LTVRAYDRTLILINVCVRFQLSKSFGPLASNCVFWRQKNRLLLLGGFLFKPLSDSQAAKHIRK